MAHETNSPKVTRQREGDGSPSNPRQTTLSEAINKATVEGYVENFKVDNGVMTDNDDNQYKPEDVVLKTFNRFEGYSDPEDNCILYILETRDGRKGILIDAYGAYSDKSISEFMKRVEELHQSR